ncbi:SAM-dependent methyltransferase [Amycolatopsis pigmentata]|uniref:SAM-dependent methyltransferase n=1 Tax=Amycolatopsis pigmentata TaxID=450801 RepID=A0ABW5G0Z9_9PSEU
MNQNRLVFRDMGCGTGSMGRWLAGRLRGPQHWVLHDHDTELLARASVTGAAADGGRVTFETREGDLAGLSAEDFAGTSLVTASALLDVLTAGQVDGLAAACAAAGCPALLTLSVTGQVEFAEPEPLDADFREAFNDHQRRAGKLGPDAVEAATEAFARHGMRVLTRPSPWRLGPQESELTAEWLKGWVGAACEQRPELGGEADAYLSRRLGERGAGTPHVVVHHTDLLALGVPS